MARIFIIGCGGVGSWLAPAICLLAGRRNVTLVDGDSLEDKNLDRQLFSEDDIGRNKAEALAEKYQCEHIPSFYEEGLVRHKDSDWLLVGVDNNAGRLSCLKSCDDFGCQAIFGANETHSSEAYYYRKDWSGTRLDPRIYYPEILKPGSDPRVRSIGCTGEAQKDNPQLVSSNVSANSLMQSLYVVWGMEAPKLSADIIPFLPFRRIINLSAMSEIKVGQA
jgi:hypothetical protein